MSEQESSAPLLATKLEPPQARDGIVLRARLVARLGESSNYRLTLLDAPAGSGKTTLLAEWHAADPTGTRSWLALDPGDNNPVRFWAYVIGTLAAAIPGFGERALQLVRAPNVHFEDTVLPELVNELAALPGPVTLVLDDYHLITSREIHRGVDALLERMPPTLRVVIATRTDPQLAVPRLRARGELLEIREAELRFSDDESAALLNDVFGLDLAPPPVERLRARTEGWAAGLVLAALSMRDRGDRLAFVEEFTGDDRHVVDYLGAEVLHRQDDEVRDFLLRTSVLDRLSAPLCDAVCGSNGSARMLAQLERANLFLVPLDPRRTWFRYHHLFADLLRYELRLAEPDLEPELHRRAAAWHLAHGSAAEGVRHALAGKDHETAADLIASSYWPMLQLGEGATVEGWLEALPAETIKADARLSVARAWVRFGVDAQTDIEPWLADAERAGWDGPMPDGTASLESNLAAARAVSRAFTGDVPGAIEAGHRVLELEDSASGFHSAALSVVGVALRRSGRLDEAEPTLQEALEIARRAGIGFTAVVILAQLALVAFARGDRERAESLADDAARLCSELGLEEVWAAAVVDLVRGLVLQAQGELEEAARVLERALVVARRGGAAIERAEMLVPLAEVRHALGDADAARALLREARAAVDRCPAPAGVGDLVTRAERRLRLGTAAVVPLGAAPDELSDRELAVLRLLGGDLSQREIGDVLYVSRNTVKSHTRSIFRKLGVSSRPDAVARARELDVI